MTVRFGILGAGRMGQAILGLALKDKEVSVSALVDQQGMLKDGYSADGLHPNVKGYELMAPLAEEAIARALP